MEHPGHDETRIEEYVRQWVLRELIDSYGYPADWLGGRLVVEEGVRMGVAVKQADISIKNDRGRTFLFVETKRSGATRAEYAAAEEQLMGYLSSTHTATIGLVTDGVTSRCLVKKIDPNDFEHVPDIPGYDQGEVRRRTRLAREVTPAMAAIGRKTGLAPMTGASEDLFSRAHAALRDVDGLHADEALDELCKLLHAKMHDERRTAAGDPGTPFRFQAYGAGNTEEVASDIRDLYKEASDQDLAVYAQRIEGYERSRGVFKRPIRASSGALARAVETLQNHSIVDTDADVKRRAFRRVLEPAVRGDMGRYLTPDPVVELAVGILAPRITDTILDPFCGTGRFLIRCLERVEAAHARGAGTDQALNQFRFFHLHGIELSEPMVRVAMCDMALHDDGHSNVRCADALLSFDNYPDIKAIGGDANADPQVFDIVVTNPPFGSPPGGEGRSAPLEVSALKRSLQFLKPGGKLAIVMQDGVLSGSGHSAVRRWLRDQGELVAVVGLPDHCFTPYGSNPKASVLFVRKHPRSDRPAAAPVFYGRVDDLGYDATGRAVGASEVPAMVEAFHERRGWRC